jgi:uncharacterized protein YciI
MTNEERDLLVSHLEKTKRNFLDSITGITDAKWRYKPSPEKWSVAECAEHIVLSEELLFGLSQKLLKDPFGPRPASSTLENDRKIIAAIEDRSQKAKAPEPLVPSGRFATPADANREFTRLRDSHIEYARGTKDELRTHSSASQLFGTIDAYQYLLFMSAHSARHTAQIREVRADAGSKEAAAEKTLYLVIYSLNGRPFDEFTPEDRLKHLAYMTKRYEQGRLLWGGLAADARQPRGVVLIQASSADEAREYGNEDPAVRAGALTFSIDPFHEVFRRTTPALPADTR